MYQLKIKLCTVSILHFSLTWEQDYQVGSLYKRGNYYLQDMALARFFITVTGCEKGSSIALPASLSGYSF